MVLLENDAITVRVTQGGIDSQAIRYCEARFLVTLVFGGHTNDAVRFALTTKRFLSRAETGRHDDNIINISSNNETSKTQARQMML